MASVFAKPVKALITSFDPFLGETVNPSQLIAQSVWARQSQYVENGIELHYLNLPVSYDRVWKKMSPVLKKLKPDVILMIGQAGGRSNVCLEKHLVNWCEAKHRDEDGKFRRGVKIISSGPDCIQSPAPVERWVKALKRISPRVQVSLSAGQFLCNQLAFLVGHESLRSSKNTMWLFVHVPFTPEQGRKNKETSLSLKTSTQIVKKIFELMITAQVAN